MTTVSSRDPFEGLPVEVEVVRVDATGRPWQWVLRPERDPSSLHIVVTRLNDSASRAAGGRVRYEIETTRERGRPLLHLLKSWAVVREVLSDLLAEIPEGV